MPDDLRPPYRIQFDNARDPYSARNALGITATGGGGGAPTDAQYIVAADDPTLTNDRVLTDTATVTWDFTVPGQAKANAATGGGGNVSNSGTPTSGQYAKWVTATTIQGVAPATVLSDIGAQPAGSYQPLDATLTALATYNTNGLLTQTAADTFIGRTLTGPAAGITVTNGNGVAGNPTLALADDLAALEALTGTNTIYYRSGASAWSAVNVSTGLAFSGGNLTATGAGTSAITQVVVRKFTASGTYTPTAGMKYCIIECVGGGGGGGAVNGSASNFYVAGGGGGGAYSRFRATAADIGASKTVTVGAGGGGGAGGTNPGGAGNLSGVGTLCTANGGAGGQYSSVGQNGSGGVGGDGSTGLGDVTAHGSPGGGGFYNAVNSTIGARAGHGGSSYFGGGAPVSSGTGLAGGNYGGGGGGATAASAIAVAGGAGSAGIVIITEYI